MITENTIKKKLSYKFQQVDTRDYIHKNTSNPSKSVYTINTIRLNNILDQGEIGSCVSNAFAYTISCMTKGNINMSRCMHYTLARCKSGISVTDDSGLYIRDACKTVASNGVCKERNYPYIPSNYFVFPRIAALKSNNLFISYVYTFINNNDINSIKNCLVNRNVPIIFGFLVYSSFMSNTVATTGIVPMPNTETELMEGGHCCCIIGFNDTTQYFTCVNSWGKNWGNKGLFYMPYTYIADTTLCSDFCYLSITY